ncbi:MAG TPA: DNA polymerase III subunit gamma/tau [Candidatus Eisenbacteria bacterium]|nr:DNA polymerase III subunit gamma/tau [Candidatus Eisenbacteria bacterium]
MTHLALARKYRPQRFADLVGQDPVRTTLERAVATNRVAHAYLFAGPRGSGKTTTARLVAKALNCERRKDGESEPCNQCRSCVEITSGTSLDVLEIDGASNRGIEEIRNLRENVKYAPSGGKSKVYIIDEAHQLTDFAWNALLKTLEEPPPHVRFVFATTEPLDVPDTIASRCQVFEFRRLRSEELVAHLETIAAAEKVKLDPEAAALIARASEGSVRDALSRLDQALSVAPEGVTADAVARALGLGGLDPFFELGDAIAARSPKQALETMDRLYDGGMDVEEIADGLAHHLRQLMLIAVDRSLEKLVDAAPSDRERYAAQAARFHANDLSAMLALLLESRGDLRRAETPRALLEVALLELCTLPSASSIDELLRRLAALESRLGGEGGGSAPGGVASAGAPAPAPRRAAAAPAPAAKPVPPRPTEAHAAGVPPFAGAMAAPDRPSPAAPARETPAAPAREISAPATPEAPAGEAAPISAGTPAGHDAERWKRIVDGVKERKLLLGTCLEEGTFLGLTGTAVRVALAPEHSFHKAMLEMKENREILNQEFERQFGRGATLACVVGDPFAATAAAERVRGELQADASAEAPEGAAAASVPRPPAAAPSIVQRIVEIFDGEILDLSGETGAPGNGVA